MSDNLCYVDAYVRSVEARLRAVEPPAAEGRGAMVLLDRTVFYPGGGGQPADRGVLRTPDGSEWTVVAARKQGDEIWHELE
ncbi:MAG TPA: alanine--tRNA ligase-related protein, partial [Candidatus Limnocylindrales bacterium]